MIKVVNIFVVKSTDKSLINTHTFKLSFMHKYLTTINEHQLYFVTQILT